MDDSETFLTETNQLLDAARTSLTIATEPHEKSDEGFVIFVVLLVVMVLLPFSIALDLYRSIR
jgi:hypothetical protein